MKKLSRWLFWLPTRSGAVRAAGLYSRVTAWYFLLTYLCTFLFLLCVAGWARHDPVEAGRVMKAAPAALGAGMGWCVDHFVRLLILALGPALIWRWRRGVSRIIPAWRALMRIIRKTEGRNI
ncbi:MAG: hypothetical protein ACYCXT_00140 [Acidiferrobacteraceae bacterium]